jgi:hypothetical protein
MTYLHLCEGPHITRSDTELIPGTSFEVVGTSLQGQDRCYALVPMEDTTDIGVRAYCTITLTLLHTHPLDKTTDILKEMHPGTAFQGKEVPGQS